QGHHALQVVSNLLTLHRDDNDRLGRHVLVTPGVAGAHRCHHVHHIHAVDHFTEHCVTEAAGRLVGVVQEVVVHQIDEELAAGTVHHLGAGHRQRAPGVGHVRPGFVLDGVVGTLLDQLRVVATALYHEAGDDPMEDAAVIEAVVGVAQEVLYGDGCLVGPQLDGHNPFVGFHDHYRIGIGGQRQGAEAHQYRQKQRSH